MAALPKCSVCGTELPPGAPGGHCLKCLLGLAEHEPREEIVFKAALNLPVGQREDYLQAACAGNAELRAQVDALLQTVGDFVNPVPTKTIKISVPLMEQPGAKIGRYKLLQQIGEGGCGVVYMADQEEPVKRRVALKVIEPGMDTKEVLGRFEAERQALALMDHSNIAKVLEAGATETGRPFFVMELVRGIPITRYCDEKKADRTAAGAFHSGLPRDSARAPEGNYSSGHQTLQHSRRRLRWAAKSSPDDTGQHKFTPNARQISCPFPLSKPPCESISR
jgi:hypothetical protein